MTEKTWRWFNERTDQFGIDTMIAVANMVFLSMYETGELGMLTRFQQLPPNEELYLILAANDRYIIGNDPWSGAKVPECNGYFTGWYDNNVIEKVDSVSDQLMARIEMLLSSM